MLVCTGGQEVSETVVNTSAALAKAAGVKMTVLYVAGVVPSMYTGLGEMEETLEELLETDTPLSQHLRSCAETLTEAGVEAQIELRRGSVVEEILEESSAGDYDLIVLGASATGIPELMTSKVTQQIINRAGSAVLVVKQVVDS
jgi:nucleotide-binding universal stress UspA family protein